MYFSLFLIFLSFLGSCSSKYDYFVDEFPLELSFDAQEKCLKENKKIPKIACEIKNCLSSPITLLGLQNLLINFDEAMKKLSIPYWIDAGTAIGAERFQAFLPWDDDIDIGVFEKDFGENKRKDLKKALLDLGFEFAPFHTIMGTLNRDGLYQVSFLKEQFLKMLELYKPDMAKFDKENMWTIYDQKGRLFPHLDILLLKEKSKDNYRYMATAFDDLCPKDFNIHTILPTKDIDILGRKYPGMNDFIKYSENCYKTKNIKTYFVIYPEHKLDSICVNFKVRLKNIKDHGEILEFLMKYLKWVFKSDYNNKGPI